MVIGDEVEIKASTEQLESIGIDYLQKMDGVVTGFYNSGYVEVLVEVTFSEELHHVDIPRRFLI